MHLTQNKQIISGWRGGGGRGEGGIGRGRGVERLHIYCKRAILSLSSSKILTREIGLPSYSK
jgi:hypothetical protein